MVPQLNWKLGFLDNLISLLSNPDSFDVVQEAEDTVWVLQLPSGPLKSGHHHRLEDMADLRKKLLTISQAIVLNKG